MEGRIISTEMLKLEGELLRDMWEEERGYFASFIEQEIDKKESKGEMVEGIFLIGNVGKWDGTKFGGKYVENASEVLDIASVDEIEVEVDDERVIDVKGIHHDGTHRMNIYIVTDGDIKRMGLEEVFDEEGIEGLEEVEYFGKIAKEVVPVKLEENDNYFRI